MNKIIVARFESHQQLLVKSPVVSYFAIVKQRLYSDRGHIRLRATLTNGGLLEFSEYLILDNELPIKYRYSFHWQDAQRRLVLRWDNARHYPHLPHAPHHIHQENGDVKGNPEAPTLAFVLRTIEQRIS